MFPSILYSVLKFPKPFSRNSKKMTRNKHHDIVYDIYNIFAETAAWEIFATNLIT